MATSSVRPLSSDPLRNFKFNVQILKPGGGSYADAKVPITNLGFMQMQGLGIAVEPLTYREGGDNLTTRKLPGQADFNPVVLSRGLFAGDSNNWQWMSQIFSAVYGGASPASPTPTDFRTRVFINILEHPNNSALVSANGPNYENTFPQQTGIVKVSFLLHSAWIMGLAYSDLDAGGNAVAIEQMTLAYEGFEMAWGGDGYVSQNWNQS